MVESLIVLFFLCLAFFLFFQFCHAFATRDMLDHAAARAARARTVGFNRWMVRKVMRVAAIPAAGRMLQPGDIPAGGNPIVRPALGLLTPGEIWDLALRATPVSPRVAIEAARIPDYLDAPHNSVANGILDYERWPELRYDEDMLDWGGADGGLRVEVRKPLAMLVSVIRGAAGILDGRTPETLNLQGQDEIELHYTLYLEDLNY